MSDALNSAPKGLTGILTPGDGATFLLTADDGIALPATLRLVITDHAGVEQTYTPTLDGITGTWLLTVAQVTALVGTLTTGSLKARITTGSGDLRRGSKAGRLSILSRYAGSGQPQSLGTTTLGPAGQSAYDVAVETGFEGTEAEWLETMTGFRAIVDPDNADLIIITYPTWALDADLTSILIPILEA